MTKLITPSSAALMLAFQIVLLSSSIEAQSYPAECIPSPNATKSCAAKTETEYEYTQTCAVPKVVFKSEQEAAASEWDWANTDEPGCPPNTYVWNGWANGDKLYEDFRLQCQGPSGNPEFPQYKEGYEVESRSLYTRTRYGAFPACDANIDDKPRSFVNRVRGLACPDGYTNAMNGYCERDEDEADLGKNLGCVAKDTGQCKAGNPINTGTGNKYQSETDFIGAGPNALRFTRFYNSAAGISSARNGLYRFSDVGADPTVSFLNPEQKAGMRAIAIGSIGMNWRHTYTRSVLERGEGDVRSASIYRQDGKVYVFNEYNGSWVADADVNFSLVELTSSGETTGWELTTPSDGLETYTAEGKLLTIASRAGVTTTLTYDTAGRLDKVTDQFGRELVFDYESAPQSGVGWWEDPLLSSKIKSVTDPIGNVYTYDYNSNGTLKSVTYPDTNVREYKYEDSAFPYALTGIVDGNGDQYATFGYDFAGRGNLSYHGIGAEIVGRVDVDYTSTGSNDPYFSVANVQVTHGLGSTVERMRDSVVEIKLGVAKMGAQTQGALSADHGYDANGNVDSYTSFDGNITSRVFNSRNLETSITEAVGVQSIERTTTTTWHPSYRLRDDVTEPMRITDYDYYPNGELQAVTVTSRNSTGTEEPSTDGNRTRVWNYEYNSFGQLTEIDGPRVDVADITTIKYYDDPSCTNSMTDGKCGQPEYVIDAEGNRTDYDEYYGDGRPKKTTDANGLTTEYEYDSRRRLTKITVSDGSSNRATSYAYDNAGKIDTITMADGLVLHYEWTTAHLVDSIEDNAGNRIEYAYDANGNRTDEDAKDPLGALQRSLESAYDDFGFVNNITVGGASIDFVYDSEGVLEYVTDSNLHPTDHWIDALGRRYKTTDALGNDTDFEYDDHDNVTKVTAANGAVTDFEYDGLGNLDNETSADRGLTDLDYDDAGNLRFRTDARNEVEERIYDKLNRVTDIRYSTAALDVSFLYDGATGNTKGRLYQMDDETGTTTFTYTKFGELDTETRLIEGVGASPEVMVLNYDYNDAGAIKKVTLPDGRIVGYSFDSQGRVSGVSTTFDGSTTTLISSIAYDPFGPMTSWTYGNNLVQTIGYDQQGMPTSMTVGSLYDVTYGLDAGDANIASITDNVSGGTDWNQTFTYDPLNRLDIEDSTTGYKNYEYDENGNRDWVKDDQSQFLQQLDYENNSNRISARNTSQSMTLDAAGNVLDDGNSFGTFDYDDRGRMSVAYVNGSAKEEYKYDGFGQRIVKVTDPGLATESVRVFTYGQGGELLMESKWLASGVRSDYVYIWLNGVPIAMVRTRYGSTGNLWDEVLTYIHPDHLGTPRVGTKSGSQTVSWRWQSDAFGNGLDESDPDGDGHGVYIMLRFPGQYFDGPTGKYYNYFRTYDPTLGRYMESDPIGLSGGSNTFGYGGGNPTNSVDPLGLYCYSQNGITRCRHPNGPVFELPTPDGFPERIKSSFFHHTYTVEREFSCASPWKVMQQLAENPTPGAPNAATRTGTRNNARVPGMPFDNWVTSYLVNDLETGQLLMVNISDSGSLFHPGYVVRTVVGNRAVTYGEGLDWKQASNLWTPQFQDFGNEAVWGNQMEELISEIECECRDY